MVAVYIDEVGDVRSRGSGRVVAPAGTTPREARVIAALWAAAADALQATTTAGSPASGRDEGMPAVVAPIKSAPSYARTVGQARRVLTRVDVGQLHAETATQLAAITGEDPTCP